MRIRRVLRRPGALPGHRFSWLHVTTWTLSLLLPAGVAYALWSASGTGDGEARSRSAIALSVAAGTASAQLYPGSTGDVVFTVTNPNPYRVSITAWSGATVTGTSDSLNCPASNFSLNAGSISAATVDGGGASATVTVTGGITMSSAAGNGCQGVTVTVNGTVTGSQV